MAATPTPEAPACTSTISPFRMRPNSNRQSCAVPNGTGIAEASSTLIPAGIFQAVRAATARSSAWLPWAPVVTTLSPTRRLSTSSPTSTTSPAAW